MLLYTVAKRNVRSFYAKIVILYITANIAEAGTHSGTIKNQAGAYSRVSLIKGYRIKDDLGYLIMNFFPSRMYMPGVSGSYTSTPIML